jgi:hypothetical protein
VGRLASFAAYASSVLHNGLRQYDAACDAARLAFEREPMGLGSHIVPELAEAAARTGDVALVEAALEWLSERARVTPTEWVLGIEAGTAAVHPAWSGRHPSRRAEQCSFPAVRAIRARYFVT